MRLDRHQGPARRHRHHPGHRDEGPADQQSASDETQATISRSIADSPSVNQVIHLKTMHMSPDDLIVAVKVDFDHSFDAADRPGDRRHLGACTAAVPAARASTSSRTSSRSTKPAVGSSLPTSYTPPRLRLRSGEGGCGLRPTNLLWVMPAKGARWTSSSSSAEAPRQARRRRCSSGRRGDRDRRRQRAGHGRCRSACAPPRWWVIWTASVRRAEPGPQTTASR